MDMSIPDAVNALRLSLTTRSRASGYECGFCHLGFDGDRLNCPACGGPVLERT